MTLFHVYPVKCNFILFLVHLEPVLIGLCAFYLFKAMGRKCILQFGLLFITIALTLPAIGFFIIDTNEDACRALVLTAFILYMAFYSLS